MSSVGQIILDALSAASNGDPNIRHRGEGQLEQLKANPDVFFSTCAELLTNPNVPTRGRQLVGYLIKNNISHPSCVQNVALQTSVMGGAVVDTEHSVRAVACSIISSAVRGLHWPLEPVVESITKTLTMRGNELHAVSGAMRALSEIVDDSIQLLDNQQLTGVVVTAILPYLRPSPSLHGDQGKSVQLRALDTASVVLENAGMGNDSFSYMSMKPHALNVIEACFINLQNWVSYDISTKCVKCIVLSLCYHDLISDELFEKMRGLMFMATASTDNTGEELRIEATEFWRGVLCFPRFVSLVEPTLQSIIPLLIRSMVYSEMEIGMLQAQAVDWNVPDKVDDIRPRHYQARVNSTGADDNDDNDEDNDDGEVEEWNLRRVSALTLDSIAECYGEKIILSVLTAIDDMMQPGKPWKELEAAILALGAIMDGCLDSMEPYLPDISARLLQLLMDPSVHFLVGTISLWTMTQIGRYVVSQQEKLQYFLNCILQKMESPSKILQEGATAALQKVVLRCGEGQLDNNIAAIIDAVVKCLRGYQLKNRVLLLETLEMICEVLGEQLRTNPDLVEKLMEPLGDIWNSTPNDSPLLFSFFRCMSRVCGALGPAVHPVLAKEIFERSYSLIVLHMQARKEAIQMNQDPPEYEFIVTAADLLSGLFDALGSALEPLVLQCQPPLVSLVLEMARDEDAEVRQGGFSLLGDMAISVPSCVQGVLTDVVTVALNNLSAPSENTHGVISNLAWFLCNLLENQVYLNGLSTLDMENGLAKLFAGLVHFLGCTPETAEVRNMAENICTCIGLMLYLNPEVVNQPGCHAALFARAFCLWIRDVKGEAQKEQTVCGFLMVMRQNLSLVIDFLNLFFDLAITVASVGPEVKRVMEELLAAAKLHNGALWQQQLTCYEEQRRVRLYHVYGIH